MVSGEIGVGHVGFERFGWQAVGRGARAAATAAAAAAG